MGRPDAQLATRWLLLDYAFGRTLSRNTIASDELATVALQPPRDAYGTRTPPAPPLPCSCYPRTTIYSPFSPGRGQFARSAVSLPHLPPPLQHCDIFHYTIYRPTFHTDTLRQRAYLRCHYYRAVPTHLRAYAQRAFFSLATAYRTIRPSPGTRLCRIIPPALRLYVGSSAASYRCCCRQTSDAIFLPPPVVTCVGW